MDPSVRSKIRCSRFRQAISGALIRLAERIDPALGRTVYPGLSLMFVEHVGVVVAPDGPVNAKFCRLKYNEGEREKAFRSATEYFTASDIPEGSREIRW